MSSELNVLKKISIISVNFNQAAVTEELLRSIELNNTYLNIEIIIIDNGSISDSTLAWKLKFPHVQFIRSEANLGFAGGNNIGIKQASGDYLFLVNNDTEFSKGLIEKLVETLEQNSNIGIISPKICYFDQQEIIQYAGFTKMNFNTGRNKCIGQFEKDSGQYDDSIGPTGYAHGAAMMIRSSVISKAGMMPETFFLYYEEMDWCERIKQAGYAIWINPKALIYHKESLSVGKNSPLKEYFMTRNRILFIRRNAPAMSQILFIFHFLFLVIPRNLFTYYKNNRPDLRKQFFRAISWNLKHNKNSTELGYSYE